MERLLIIEKIEMNLFYLRKQKIILYYHLMIFDKK
ncbi:hypothetical protein Cycma_4283 [Cyclobacterium marinum DSM 745]|uniref:Uncharacterized protein n=1 Tax=Cyclobacterium marinum (strain ATCC 25205 / DSM 745 / LMG 13164 / NCIMB 1802) TaxID=880070 RepID=G0IWJ2_CYCMS|nr:hypothetical protein Cycma_4283 [Cyclobacterium marinum DSM 745]